MGCRRHGSTGGRAIAGDQLACDVTDPRRSTRPRYHRGAPRAPDILVNNAGIAGPNFRSTGPAAEWRRVVEIDLSACSSAAAPSCRGCAGRITGGSSTSPRSREGQQLMPRPIRRRKPRSSASANRWARKPDRHQSIVTPGRRQDRHFRADERGADRLYAVRRSMGRFVLVEISRWSPGSSASTRSRRAGVRRLRRPRPTGQGAGASKSILRDLLV